MRINLSKRQSMALKKSCKKDYKEKYIGGYAYLSEMVLSRMISHRHSENHLLVSTAIFFADVTAERILRKEW